jgi:hypothetical protein
MILTANGWTSKGSRSCWMREFHPLSSQDEDQLGLRAARTLVAGGCLSGALSDAPVTTAGLTMRFLTWQQLGLPELSETPQEFYSQSKWGVKVPTRFPISIFLKIAVPFVEPKSFEPEFHETQ